MVASPCATVLAFLVPHHFWCLIMLIMDFPVPEDVSLDVVKDSWIEERSVAAGLIPPVVDITLLFFRILFMKYL